MRTRHQPMRRTGARWLAAACLLLLPACSPQAIEMEISEADGQHHVLLYKRGWFGMRSGETPCVRGILLRHAATQATAWQAELADDRSCAKLERFTVGRAPAGFAERVRFVRDRAGGRHELEVWGIGSGVGAINF